MNKLLVETTGLCFTCMHEYQCMYRLKHTRGVCFCEHFENAGYTRVELSAKEQAPAGTETTGAKAYAGLCSDCATRDECVLSNTQGGIWSCDNYS